MRWAVLLLLFGCAGAKPPPKSATEPPPKRATNAPPELAPVPFSAEELRDGQKAGRTMTWRVEASGAVEEQEFRFTEVLPERARFEAGPVGGPYRSGEAKWSEFVSHASYPKASTVITDARVEVPAGSFDCMLYTVTEGDKVTRAWFARSLPGAPVKHEVTVDGQVVSTTVLKSLDD